MTLDFHFHHGELANVQTLGCRFPGVVPLHRTGDVLHSPGHAAIVGCLDGLLEENNASVVLGLLGDESLGDEMG